MLNAYIPVSEAIARLFAPHVEVVLHDLRTQTIMHIANCISKRRVGDSSLTDTTGMDTNAVVVGPYLKTNWDGRRLKSISAIIRDAEGAAIGLLCVNHDIEPFSDVLDRLLELVASPVPTPSVVTTALFASDWRERINEQVGAFLAQRNLTLAAVQSSDVNALLGALDHAGVFGIRNAPSYVAEVLGMSRATLYSRLKIARTSATPDQLPTETNNAPHDA